jgi:hypothetical protein
MKIKEISRRQYTGPHVDSIPDTFFYNPLPRSMVYHIIGCEKMPEIVAICRNEKLYSNTCIQLPYDLKMRAKEQGVNLTQTLVHALEQKCQEPIHHEN